MQIVSIKRREFINPLHRAIIDDIYVGGRLDKKSRTDKSLWDLSHVDSQALFNAKSAYLSIT